MADPRGIKTTELRRMREMRAAGASCRETAASTGRCGRTVTKYTGEAESTVRARRYDAWVRRMAAFVPVFGGARG